MKRRLLKLSLFVVSSPLLHAQQQDVEARAMRDEMQRSMKELRLESMERPYYIAYKIVDIDRKEAQASFGSLTSSGEIRNRILTVNVRIGICAYSVGTPWDIQKSIGSARISSLPQMYGPPSDCKGKAKSGSTDLRKCIRPLGGEQSLLAMMRCAACSS